MKIRKSHLVAATALAAFVAIADPPHCLAQQADAKMGTWVYASVAVVSGRSLAEGKPLKSSIRCEAEDAHASRGRPLMIPKLRRTYVAQLESRMFQKLAAPRS